MVNDTKNALVGGILGAQTQEIGFVTGEVGFWSQWLGRGERWWEQPKLGAVQDKSPRMKDGGECREGTRSGENEGRGRERLAISGSYEQSRAEIRTTLGEKAATAKLNGLWMWDVSRHCIMLLGLLIPNVSADVRGDGCKLWAHAV